jgi:hypothetical protein
MNAMNGMEMMLKSMGINPEEIKASIEGFKKLATEVSERQKAVETSLLGIHAKLDELLSRGLDVVSRDDMLEHFGGKASIGIIAPEEAIKQREQPSAESTVTDGNSPGSGRN